MDRCTNDWKSSEGGGQNKATHGERGDSAEVRGSRAREETKKREGEQSSSNKMWERNRKADNKGRGRGSSKESTRAAAEVGTKETIWW